MDPNRENNTQATTSTRETVTTTPVEAPVTPVTNAAATATDPNKVPGSVLAARVVYYIGGAIISLLALRFVLAMLGANRENPFADFVFGLSYPFAYPFFGLFSYEPSYQAAVLELGTVVAIIVYALATAGIAKLFTLSRRDA